MKTVIYTDPDGLKHLSTIRDNDTDASIGILQSPPDLRQLDWQEIPKEIHNLLVEGGFFSLKDVQIRQTEFNKIINSTIIKRIFRLYQEQE